MESKPALVRAVEFSKSLDSLISVYERPTGEVAVHGIKAGRAIYKVFKEY